MNNEVRELPSDQSSPTARTRLNQGTRRLRIPAAGASTLAGGNASVNGLFVECVVDGFQMRNFQCAHGLDRRTERFIGAAVLSQGLSRGP
jgi:hypothetical protein